MTYNKPKLIYYRIAQAVSWLVAKLIFRRKVLRNEIKEAEGPFVVIANHQASLDFVNLIGMSRRPMSFVISNSFYNTLPIKGFLNKMGVIPKQQFQTSIKDMKMMRAVIESGNPLVIYPAGLMCEDGLSTPIPEATYKFLKWLKADVYVARTSGTYFAMPKWTKGLRPGRTYLDVYKLFSKEELSNAAISEIKEKTENAILFDAYREQESIKAKYLSNRNVEGLEHVLYMCPHCKKEFSIAVKNKHTLYCRNCGFEQTTDAYAFMHNTSNIGPEIRYVSDWSKLIYNELKADIICSSTVSLTASTDIRMIDYSKNKFVNVGSGALTISADGFRIHGEINGKDTDFTVSIANVPSFPFSPGKYLEVQNGSEIYRCALHDGKLVMKYINMLKIFYELDREHVEDKAQYVAR